MEKDLDLEDTTSGHYVFPAPTGDIFKPKLPKDITIEWVGSYHDCDDCGTSSVTEIVIKNPSGNVIASDRSGGCFGNVYEGEQSAVESILKLLGINCEIVYSYKNDDEESS